MTTSVGNNSVFRSFFEKQKLTGPNFIDWAYSSEDLELMLQWVKGIRMLLWLMLVTMELWDCEEFHTCKQGGKVNLLAPSSKMKGYIVNLEDSNFNMHGMGKTVNELHAMLKLHEESLPKKDANPALHAIRVGRVQKNQKNKPHKACWALEKDCPVYLTELMKKKKLPQGASASGLRGSRKLKQMRFKSDTYGRWFIVAAVEAIGNYH
ncbi:hypothetical protein Tco_0254913 [Tanacetum coccineum]